jgi:dipeptidyl aminopeptidase/acylaminoacyl peptidase
MAKGGAGWRDIFRQENKGRLRIYGLSADGAGIVAAGEMGAGRIKLVSLALDGSGSKVLLEDPANDVTGVIRDRFTGAPVAAVMGGLTQDVRWFDPQAERRFKSVVQAFPGRRVDVYGESENRQRVVAAVEGPSNPTVFYLVDFKTNKADIVGEAYPELASMTLGEVRDITYKARDGVAIPAYLTIPPGNAGKNLPLVVLPHGGPEARDDAGFNWWAQFLALRGYAVLQPQFRGSTGFGADFQRAGYRQWGGVMQDDVTDGVKSLIDQGVADAKRVCIVGGSYGGYAALAGAAYTPELYACAVSVNGVSDLPGMIGYVVEHSGGGSDALAYWREHIGPATDQNVIAKSPFRNPERFKAPVLLLYAAEDTVVPAFQSEGMAQALSKLGKPATLVKLTGEDHWLSRTDSRVQVLKEIEKFLAANLSQAP